MNKFLGKSVVIGSLLLCGAAAGYSQSDSAARDEVNANGQAHHERNWSWIGLLGLAGLAGLKSKKSEDVRKLEAHGVKVQTV